MNLLDQIIAVQLVSLRARKKAVEELAKKSGHYSLSVESCLLNAQINALENELEKP